MLFAPVLVFLNSLPLASLIISLASNSDFQSLILFHVTCSRCNLQRDHVCFNMDGEATEETSRRQEGEFHPCTSFGSGQTGPNDPETETGHRVNGQEGRSTERL